MYFDCESFGRDQEMSGYVTLYENGYIDDRISGRGLDAFDQWELSEEIAERFQAIDPEISQSAMKRADCAAIAKVEKRLLDGESFSTTGRANS